jgi:hypothetical protein
MGWKQNKNKSGSETNNESLNKAHNNTENKTNAICLNKKKKNNGLAGGRLTEIQLIEIVFYHLIEIMLIT